MSRRHRRPSRRRTLSLETLEGRRLLVVGVISPVVPPQNFANPEDINYDGAISPADALIVINELNNAGQSGSPTSSSTDVDGDGVVTPRDALLIINRINSRSDISGVPPEQRAIGLRQALDEGYVPPNMSLSAAQEMLETLERGGHYEAGERYRNGEMININDQPDALDSSVVSAEGEGPHSTEQSAGSTNTNLDEGTSLPQSVTLVDPLALLDSADDALAERLHDGTLWRALANSRDADHSAFIDRLSMRISDRIADRQALANARERFAHAIADALESGDKSVEEIVDELRALKATLGDAHSQIAQLFANLDVDGILDQLDVDLGTLARAVVSHGDSIRSDHDEVFAAFFGRDYLRGLPTNLP